MASENTFNFSGFSYHGPSRTMIFEYAVSVNGERMFFKEKLFLPREFEKGRTIDGELFEILLLNLHLVLGVSYWKMHCLRNIRIDNYELNPKQANFWDTLYRKGLGEFFYKNSVDFRNLRIFPSVALKSGFSGKNFSGIKKRALIGIGGGKDSALAIEILKQKKIEVMGFFVSTDGRHGAEEEIARIAGIDYIRVERVIDPQLISLEKQGRAMGGHVPVSALYAFLGVLIGALYGYSYVFTGNERSADYGNLKFLGEEINHQWSKSSEFEQMFRDYSKEFMTPTIRYGSILRQYSELKIVEMFTQYPQYFNVFSSCNSVSVRGGRSERKWCLKCAKCAFVFICMAAFLSKEKIIKIFGGDMYADTKMSGIFRQLLGIEGVKPFDCVGTPDEVKVAMFRAYNNGGYAGTPAMEIFKKEILSGNPDFAALEKTIMNPLPIKPLI